MLPADSPDLSATLLEAIDRAGLGLTITVDEGGVLRRTYSNPAFCALTGYDEEALRAIAPTALTPPAEQARLAALRRAHAHGEPFPPTVETALVRRDGTVVPVEVSHAAVAVGARTATVVFVRDIRERERVATALRESEARFRSLAEASPDSIVVIRDRAVVYANPASAHVLGFDSPAEFMARPLSELLIDPDEMRLMGERIGAILAGQQLPPREYTGRRRDGTGAVMEISTTRVTYDGQPAVLALGRDTSERRAWHAELLRGDRLASLGVLAASVAHEINNPLTYVLLHLERLSVLVEGAIPDPATRARARDLIANAREGGGRVRTIVGELLSVARHDHEAEPIQVEAALDAALRLAGPTVAERAEVVRRGGGTPPVIANVGRLSQVFLNLLLNAADAFARPGGDNRVEVEVGHDAGHVHVRIRDNGPGVPRDQLAAIFEPRFTTKPRGTGTGLGLSICKGIVTELGGTIEASAPAGGGTCIEVRIPTAPPPLELPTPVPPVLVSRRRRIAIIDDDVLVARAFAALVATRHAVEMFTAPRAALAALADGPAFDHVLCDVNMPGLTGPDLFLALVARRPEYVGRFTMITGGAVSARLAAMVGRGEVGFLPKPFDTATLLRILDGGEVVPGAGLEPA